MSHSYRPYLLDIRGKLSITDFHIGSGARLSISTDAPLLLDHRGYPYLPASSLRGVIRSHILREARLILPRDRTSLCDSLFGRTPLQNETFPSYAGRLRVFDASLPDSRANPPVKPYTEIRDHVKLGIETGAHEHGAKFDQQVAESEELDFRLTYEGESAKDSELQLVHEIVRALQAGDLSCGAKGSLGYGRLQLNNPEYAEFDRTQPAALAGWLNGRIADDIQYQTNYEWRAVPPEGDPDPSEKTSAPDPECFLDLSLLIQFEGPVLVRAPLPPLRRGVQKLDARNRANDAVKGQSTADSAFIQTGKDRQYYFPASSLRGVLRHHASSVANTVGLPAADLIRVLFGDEDKLSGRKGLLQVRSGRLPGNATPAPVYLDHVAIDRLTGFAADKKKFATCGLQSPTFEAGVRLRFGPREMYLVALFGFVLRDLIDGMLWCGGGTSRGYGCVKSVAITGSVVNWTPVDGLPPEVVAAGGSHRPGRARVVAKGDFPFDNWFWRIAQKAWIDYRAQFQPASGEQPK